MTDDAKLFPPVKTWENDGFKVDEYGHWLKGPWEPAGERINSAGQGREFIRSRDGTEMLPLTEAEKIAVPFYQGVMMNQLDPSSSRWESGTGLKAKWSDIPWNEKSFHPQYLINSQHCFGKHGDIHRFKVAIRDIARTTDERTMIAAAIPGFPTGNACPVFQCVTSPTAFAAVLDSYSYDYVARMRSGGTHMNYYILAETPLPKFESIDEYQFQRAAAALGTPMKVFAREWMQVAAKFPQMRSRPWQGHWALTAVERLRLRCVIECVVAHQFGIEKDQFAFILCDCDHPRSDANANEFSSRLDPKGFWRVDKEKDPELRHTVLAQVAYADLCAQGLEAFLTGPDGDGWQLPETLRLADYGLGHDTRALAPQPVAPRLGPRFLDWQLQKDPAQSWQECEAHAAQLESLWSHARTLAGVEATESSEEAPPATIKHQTIETQPELF
uniref:hypothetical protein n=1 Tax=Prosthecobacter sp. TaxID=1965333 RepID=UPI003784BA79